jgi:hypothetical protein
LTKEQYSEPITYLPDDEYIRLKHILQVTFIKTRICGKNGLLSFDTTRAAEKKQKYGGYKGVQIAR